MNLRTLIIPLMLAGTFILPGCKKDKCKDVTCLNGGSCADGVCSCPAGFEGSDCGTSTRAKFLGVYNVNEACSSGNANFQMQVSAGSSNATAVIISNFYGIGMTVSGSISGSSMTIPTQQVTVQGASVTVNGSGQISGNILTLSYTVGSGGQSDACTATCTRL